MQLTAGTTEAPPVRHGPLGIAAVLAANVFWSFGGVFGKKADAGGVVLSFWRMWVATGIMLVVALVLRRMPSRSDIVRAAPLGVLFGLNICAFFITLEYISIAVAVIVGALTPVVALPIAVVFMGERLTMVKMVCAVVAVGGVVVAVLAAPQPATDEGSQLVGYLWAVVSLLVWVVYLLLSKRVRAHVEVVPFMLVMSAVGGVAVSVMVVLTQADLGRLQGTGWWWVVLLAIGPGLAGHGLVAWAHPRVDVSVSTLLIQAEPVGATVAAWAILGERVSLVQGLAMVAVLVALGVLAYREARDSMVALGEAVA